MIHPFEANKHHFARVMLHKLTGANQHKESWQNLPLQTCAELCMGEYLEVVDALNKELPVWELVQEYADVANYAMFIYNNLDSTFVKRANREKANLAGVRNFLLNLRLYEPKQLVSLRRMIERLVSDTKNGYHSELFDSEEEYEQGLRRLCLEIGSLVCWNSLELSQLVTLPELQALPAWTYA